MDDLQLGELIGTVKSIKENTDKIPDLAELVAVHSSILKDLKPKVEAHEKTSQRAYGVAGILVAISGLLESMLWYKHG